MVTSISNKSNQDSSYKLNTVSRRAYQPPPPGSLSSQAMKPASSSRSSIDSDCSALAFFVRTNNALRILTLGRPNPEGILLPRELAKLPHVPKSAAWSHDSQSLAVGDTTKGVVVISLKGGAPEVSILPRSHVGTQKIWWSPTSRYLVTHHPPEKANPGEKQKPNLLVWSVGPDPQVQAGFLIPKFDVHRKSCPLIWTPDEKVCVRILPPEKGSKESVLHLLPGDDLNATPFFEIRESRSCLIGQWCPVGNLSYEGEKLVGRLALFVADGRNDMQRVNAPAEVRMYHCNGKRLELMKRCETPSGETAELEWSASGDALLGLVETEVDETGVSYYGSTRLLLVSSDPNTVGMQELNKDTAGQYMPIQAVAWSPTDDIFVLVRGFQPAHVSLWKYDRLNNSASMLSTLAEKSHRNTVKWNKFGSVCLIGGFGNLAGEMDFFGMTEPDRLERVATSQANCTVSVEWSADGLHAITAVLAPRMRVENGFTVWNCLTGKAKHTERFDELFEVGVRPHNGRRCHFEGPQRLEIREAANALSKTSTSQPKRQAYRPPHARGPATGPTAASNGQGENFNGSAASVSEVMRGVKEKTSPSPRGGKEKDEEGGEDRQASIAARTKAVAKEPQWRKEEKDIAESCESPKAQNGKIIPEDADPTPKSLPQKEDMKPPPEEKITQVGSGLPQQSSSQPGPNHNINQQQGPSCPIQQIEGKKGPRTNADTATKGAIAPHSTGVAEYYASKGYKKGPTRPGTAAEEVQEEPPVAQDLMQLQMAASREKSYNVQQVSGSGYPGGYPPSKGGKVPLGATPQQFQGYYPPVPGSNQFQGYYPQYPGAQQWAAQQAALMNPGKGGAQPGYPGYPVSSSPYGNPSPGGYPPKYPCPGDGWQYVDPKGNVQGPFILEEMQQWHALGYFKPELKMRWQQDMEFLRFDLLFPPGVTPFSTYPNLENLYGGRR